MFSGSPASELYPWRMKNPPLRPTGARGDADIPSIAGLGTDFTVESSASDRRAGQAVGRGHPAGMHPPAEAAIGQLAAAAFG